MEASGELAPVVYRAFVSYSHRDAAWGGKLHRRLEGYRLPKHCRGAETAFGAVPAQLTPIFRDREELSAGADLSEQVRSALVVSGALVVLCSPNACASKWVNKEIETFRSLHPDRPILAALIEGEPAEAFPSALTAGGAEPIAADFRNGGDGMRLGLLKLIAGMTGLGLDTLVQRDAQRQVRRVTVVTLSALAAVITMALLLVMALRAQREAEIQRAQAEGLVEYMLTDLRERLRGVGRLDVMTAVNERAMTYYGSQGDISSLPPESLDRRARILHAMGEDDEKRGDLDKALAKFTEAHRATSAVLARKPDDPEAIFAHAQSEYWVGHAHEVRRDWPHALKNYENYAARAKQLIARDPQNPAYMMEVGWGFLNVGLIHLQGRKDHKQARVAFNAALPWFEDAASHGFNRATTKYEIANLLAWLADTYFAEALEAKGGQSKTLYRTAADIRARQIELLEELVRADPKNETTKLSFATAQNAYAVTLGRAGETDQAIRVQRDSEQSLEASCRHDRTNKNWCSLADQAAANLEHFEKAIGSSD